MEATFEPRGQAAEHLEPGTALRGGGLRRAGLGVARNVQPARISDRARDAGIIGGPRLTGSATDHGPL
jgi:hypothetical protein